MASKSIKLTPEEAGVIITYQEAVMMESGVVLDTAYELLDTLGLNDNEEVCERYNKIFFTLVNYNILEQYPKIMVDLSKILNSNKAKISKNKLKKVRALFGEFLTLFEENHINFYSKLKLIRKGDVRLQKAEIKALEDMKNVRFLVNRVIKLIDSKI